LGVRPVGKAAASEAAESSEPRPAPAAVKRSTFPLAGRSFARLTVLPLLVVIGWLLPGIPLLVAGRFLPVPMVLIAAPLAAILMVATLREVPSRWPRPLRLAGGAGSDAADADLGPAAPADTGGTGVQTGGADAGVGAGDADAGTGLGTWAEAHVGAAPDIRAHAGDVAVGAADAPALDAAADAPALDAPAPDAVEAPEREAAEPEAVGAPEREAGDAEERLPRAWPVWWGLGGTVAVAVGFAAWQILLNSPQIIVLRSPGALFQFGYWIAEHGLLPIPQTLAAFGGSHPGLTFSSPGFSQQGVGIVPQFMAGLPMVLSAGFWVHGVAGGALVSPILGAFAVLTFGGLAGRLAGPQWAPAAALVLALTLPEQYISRSAFAEPLVQVLMFGGLCLVIDSLAVDPLTMRAAGHARPSWAGAVRWPDWLASATAAAAIGGLALGLASLVAISSLAVVAPVILFLGALVGGRRYQAVPFGGGLLIGAGCGLAAGYLLAPSSLRALGPSLRDLGLIIAGLVVVAAAGIAVAWYGPARRRMRRLLTARPLRWLPEAAGWVCLAAAIAFAIRPFVQIVRGDTNPSTVAYVAALQRLLHLPVDPTRLYSERSLYWVIWYVGVPAVLLGGFGIALLTRRCLRALLTWRDADGMARLWALPLMIIGWATVSVLWRPGTVPDQPWASRRLVPVLLPGLILCGIWVSSWLAVRARERGAGPGALAAASACFVAALALPTALATFG
jgi:hypothetical protein